MLITLFGETCNLITLRLDPRINNLKRSYCLRIIIGQIILVKNDSKKD